MDNKTSLKTVFNNQ